MGVLSLVLGLPFHPVRGVIALAELIEEEVERELYAPASIRRDLETADEAGQSDAERAEIQRHAVERAVRSRGIDTEAR